MAGGGGEPNRKPDNTNFKQQTLPAWTPTLTPLSVVGCFATIGIPFIAIGAVLISATSGIIEHTQRYDAMSSCSIKSNGEGKLCEISFKVDEEMKQPVYVYYQLSNFYQNHRTYVKSRSDKQLLGARLERALDSDEEKAALLACSPRKKARINGESKDLRPCGLVANSLFDDIISLDPGASALEMKENDIAWETDVDNKFDNPYNYKDVSVACSEIASCINQTFCDAEICSANGLSSGCQGYQCVGGDFDRSRATGTASETCDAGECRLFYYPDADKFHDLHELYPDIVSPVVGMTNEHFIVWMRTAGLPEFRKLYGRIETDIPAGETVTFNVTNNFHVGDFEGEKALVMTTLSWVGGKNYFLGIAYVVVGALCVVLAILFGVKQLVSPRKLGDPRYLQWNDK